MEENRNCNCLRVFARGQLIISFMLMVNILLTLSSLILEDIVGIQHLLPLIGNITQTLSKFIR